MKPGVYLMKDSANNIIYVGKSKNLRNRVTQYFQTSKNHSPKIKRMVKIINSFDYILTDTELDALLLECRLIKDLQPMFNSLMKNEKGYPYIKVTVKEDYPRVFTVYEVEDDKALYFGPYPNLNSTERIIEFIKQRFPIRRCGGEKVIIKSSACLNHDLGLCLAPCQGLAEKDHYMEVIDEVISLLKGNGKGLLEEVKEKMEKASQELDFEKAANYRDQIPIIKHVLYRQNLIKSLEKQKNIIVLEYMDVLLLKVFLIKGNKLLNEVIIDLNEVHDLKIQNIVKNFILSCNDKLLKNDMEKLTRRDIDEGNIIFSYLRSKKKNLYHMIIPNTWLKEKNSEKLTKGIEKLIGKIS